MKKIIPLIPFVFYSQTSFAHIGEHSIKTLFSEGHSHLGLFLTAIVLGSIIAVVMQKR